MERIRISAGSRLHFGLLDLTGDLGRVDGGVGLYLARPRIVIEAEKSRETKSDYSADLVNYALNRLNQHFGMSTGIIVRVIESYDQHAGLGSSTQFLLSLGMAFCKLNKLSCPPRELALILGRGGTSGIGVAGFDKGGFIVDAGHSFGTGKNKESFLPSRASNSPPAPVLLQSKFPRDWIIEVVVPKIGHGLSGNEEIEFFKTHCPIEASESDAIARAVFSCVVPGIIEEDIATFARGINLLTTLGFKKREIDNQFNDLKLTLQNLKDITQGSAAIGISSFGPALFIIWNNKIKSKHIFNVSNEIKLLLDKHGGISYTTKGRNMGATTRRLY